MRVLLTKTNTSILIIFSSKSFVNLMILSKIKREVDLLFVLFYNLECIKKSQAFA